jgi:hypothetical protein
MTQLRHTHQTKLALALVLLLRFVPTASGTIIDDFSTPQGPLTVVGGFASGPGIMGNSREVIIGEFFEATGGGGNFATTGVDSGMGFLYGSLGILPVDITDGGVANVFLLNVMEFEGEQASAWFVFRDFDFLFSSSAFLLFNAPGLYSTPIPTDVDITRITQLEMFLDLAPVPAGGASIRIDFICTGTVEAGCTTADAVTGVPEPATAVLFGLGLVVLALLGWAESGRKRNKSAVSNYR